MKVDKVGTTNFQAVNQKYLQKAIKGYNRFGSFSGELLECLRADVFFRAISARDGLDTLEAIRKYGSDTIDFLEHVKENFEALLKRGY